MGEAGHVPLGASRRGKGVPIKSAVIFCDTKYTKMFRQGGHGRTNHVHIKMHILHVISSVSRSSKCNKIVGGWGFAPDPTGGAYSAPQAT